MSVPVELHVESEINAQTRSVGTSARARWAIGRHLTRVRALILTNVWKIRTLVKTELASTQPDLTCASVNLDTDWNLVQWPVLVRSQPFSKNLSKNPRFIFLTVLLC